jgi:hypothetical protein
VLDIAVNRALADFAGFRLPDRRSDINDATVWQLVGVNLLLLVFILDARRAQIMTGPVKALLCNRPGRLLFDPSEPDPTIPDGFSV